jgi:hypothetical protein
MVKASQQGAQTNASEASEPPTLTVWAIVNPTTYGDILSTSSGYAGLSVYPGGSLYGFVCNTSNTARSTPTITIDGSKWTFVAMTYAPSTSLQFYISGSLVANTTSYSGGCSATAPNYWMMGKTKVNGWYGGQILDAGYSSTELTATQVAQLYNALKTKYSGVPIQ